MLPYREPGEVEADPPKPPTTETSTGAYLHALRLVGFDRKKHRVALTVDGGAILADAILNGCSGPLLSDAAKALAAGETLTFGRVHLTRTELTVEGASARWSEIRLARLQPARVSFFRRLPLFAWRSVRLDRIPNPTIFCALVMRYVTDVRRDGALMLELDRKVDIGGIPPRAGDLRRTAIREMLIGGVMFVVGVAITLAGLVSRNGAFVIAFGPIIWGGIRFVRGFDAWR